MTSNYNSGIEEFLMPGSGWITEFAVILANVTREKNTIFIAPVLPVPP